MKYNINYDINVDSKWKILNKVLYYGFLLFMTLGFLTRMFKKENHNIDNVDAFVHIIFIVFILAWIILSITYLIKPSLFYKKDSNEK